MEDWYIALVQASSLSPNTSEVFSISDMRALVDTIDTEPDPIPMRWLNAMLGRMFFGLYRTEAVEQVGLRHDCHSRLVYNRSYHEEAFQGPQTELFRAHCHSRSQYRQFPADVSDPDRTNLTPAFPNPCSRISPRRVQPPLKSTCSIARVPSNPVPKSESPSLPPRPFLPVSNPTSSISSLLLC